MTDPKSSSAGVPDWTLVSRFLLWLGGSTGAIGIVLSTFGFLVEHADFDRLGIPRSLYQATPREYLVTGGKFLLGILPLAFTGLLQFCVNYWWFALAVGLIAALMRWKRGSSRIRWIIATFCLAASLAIIGSRFRADGSPDYAGVAMFTFAVVTGAAYAFAEWLYPAASEPANSHPISHYAWRVPFMVILICALIALPYLRGYYALKRNYPVVQFLGKDQAYFRELTGSQATHDLPSSEQETWQIIDIGTERAILRRVADSRIYVVPATALTTFRILGKE